MFPRAYDDTKHAELLGLVWRAMSRRVFIRQECRVGDCMDAEGAVTWRVLCRALYEGTATLCVLWKECGERRLGESVV